MGMTINIKDLVHDSVLSHMLNIKYLLPARALWRGAEIMSLDEHAAKKSIKLRSR
jgi:hypothetical protein